MLQPIPLFLDASRVSFTDFILLLILYDHCTGCILLCSLIKEYTFLRMSYFFCMALSQSTFVYFSHKDHMVLKKKIQTTSAYSSFSKFFFNSGQIFDIHTPLILHISNYFLHSRTNSLMLLSGRQHQKVAYKSTVMGHEHLLKLGCQASTAHEQIVGVT